MSVLLDAPYNPRVMSEQARAGLAESLDHYGYLQPIVWNKRTGHVVGGHQRKRKLLGDGVREVDVVVVDMDEKAEMALNIALNSQFITGQWDYEKLGALVAGMEDSLRDVTFLDPVELEKICNLEFTRPTEPVPDVIPDLPKKPVSRAGEIWLLGRHRLRCGSCVDIGLALDGRKWDLLVTDPPYGVSYADKNVFLNAIVRGNRIQTPIENDHHTPDEMYRLWVEWFSVLGKCGAAGASYYTTGPQGGELLLLFLLALRDSGFPLRHMLIWVKNNMVLGRCDYHYQHEPILYGWLDGSAHHDVTDRGQTSTWFIDKPHESKLHPTMKPVELYRRAILNSSNRGGLVVDPFGGSGTAWVACEQLDRVCCGTEVSPAYCDVIIERWQTMSGGKAIRARGE